MSFFAKFSKYIALVIKGAQVMQMVAQLASMVSQAVTVGCEYLQPRLNKAA